MNKPIVYFLIYPIKLSELVVSAGDKYSFRVNLSPFKLINSSLNSLSENSSELAILEYSIGDK